MLCLLSHLFFSSSYFLSFSNLVLLNLIVVSGLRILCITLAPVKRLIDAAVKKIEYCPQEYLIYEVIFLIPFFSRFFKIMTAILPTLNVTFVFVRNRGRNNYYRNSQNTLIQSYICYMYSVFSILEEGV